MATMPVIFGTATRPDMMPIALLPTTMAIRAVAMGRLIAMSEPNAMARMNTAITMPISSLLPPAGRFAYPRPPSYSTWMPASRAACTASCAASYSVVPIFSTSKPTVAKAVCPSALRVGPRGSYGLLTAITCGPADSCSTACSTTAFWSGPVRPSSEWKMTFEE